MVIDIIVGARPNFMKVAPIIRALEVHSKSGGLLTYRLIHTGQHYHPNLSEAFFKQLSMPKPLINFNVGSGSQAEQTGKIMVKYEEILTKKPSKACLVVGDVNSTMACAIVAQKSKIPVAHVEGGLRSGDWSMPEEINRIITDAISNWFFTTSETANQNLLKLGVAEDRIFFVGNTMIDTLLKNRDYFVKPLFYEEYNLQLRKYFVCTLHRPSNVDDLLILKELIFKICLAVRNFPVILPVHPRTSQALKKLDSIPPNLYLVDAQPYLEFNYIVQNSMAVITDSGGVTEETTVLGIPCLTLRSTTERLETVSIGTNELIGTNPSAIKPAIDRLFLGEWKKGSIPKKWDGKAGERIVKALVKLLC